MHDYDSIVQEALTSPGKLHESYSRLWEFSMGNQWLAMMQIGEPQPIATFNKWKEIGRHVKKGSKAIELLMPVLKKAKDEVTGDDQKKMFFLPKRYWFALSQTDGQDYTPAPIPDFDIKRMLAALNITQQPYQSMSGNSMGYAMTDQRIIAVSPLAFDPVKTTFHEVAHVLLHPGIVSDHDKLPKDVREVEAELTSYLVKSSLGLFDNLDYARGYIRNWIGDTSLEKVRFSKVFAAADTILKAGREPKPELPIALDHRQTAPATLSL
jgi:hypothetical protein